MRPVAPARGHGDQRGRDRHGAAARRRWLRERTEALIATPPDIVVATTGIGFRGWVAAADGWGLANDLIGALAKPASSPVGRRPPERCARRGSRGVAGFRVLPGTAALSGRGRVAGQRIAVQLHRATDDWDPFPEFLDELRSRGHRWCPFACTAGGRRRPRRLRPTGHRDRRAAVRCGELHLGACGGGHPFAGPDLGIEDQVITALRTGVHAMCVGPVTARPLVRLGVPTSAPERMRLGALARHITDELPVLQSRTCAWRGTSWRSGAPACWWTAWSRRCRRPRWRRRALAQRPGTVVSAATCWRAARRGTDTHAVETAVLRLRTALGDKHIVSTVVKRGYRLATRRSLAYDP